jgi:hypothetical protein
MRQKLGVLVDRLA